MFKRVLFLLMGLLYIGQGLAGAVTTVPKLTASDGIPGNNFGLSVSMSGDGNIVVVGAPNPSGSHQGSAYIFVRSEGIWSQQQKLTASDGATGDHFGSGTSMSGDGNTVVVGAYGDDIGSNTNQGSAYIFVRSGGVWSQQQKLTASDGAEYDYFGMSVSISGDGNSLLVGALGDDIGSNINQGSAYIFVRSDGVWSQQQKLTASDGISGNHLGSGTSMSGDGNTVVIGAYDDNTYKGSAYVFVRSGGVWSQQQKLTASDGISGNHFGSWTSMSGDGNTVVVGAYDDDIGSNTNQGSAYVFVRSGGVWSQQQKLTASDGAEYDYFGMSVSISGDGNSILVGALDDNIGSNLEQGSAYVFVRSGGVWSQQQKLTASDGTTDDNFGSVSINGDGTTLLIGALADRIGNNTEQGSAYVFVRSGGVWLQQQMSWTSTILWTGSNGVSFNVSDDGTKITILQDAAPSFTFSTTLSGYPWCATDLRYNIYADIPINIDGSFTYSDYFYSANGLDYISITGSFDSPTHASGTFSYSTNSLTGEVYCWSSSTWTATRTQEDTPLFPVYRFWSNVYLGHFYTISEADKDYVIATWPDVWTYEGPVFYAYTTQAPGTLPVYRFWSDTFLGHFYTISEAEKDYVIATWPDVWTYEGPVFYAYTTQAPGTLPVYRFWSDTFLGHFYTISEIEKQYVIDHWPPPIWEYEGPVYYAFPIE
jgi:hypothetical protein